MTRARTTGASRSWSWPIWAAVAIIAGLVAGTMPAEAANGKSDAKKAEASADVDRTIETAIAALESGKTDLAVQELTTAITGGKIAQSKLARALYYRGLAYRKQSKPAQAIADFTSALWIKNGLDAQQQADALVNRAGAYRDAGLTDQAEADEKRVAATTGAARAAPAASSTGESTAAPAASGGGLGGFFNALFGGAPATTQEPASQGFATAVSPTSDSPAGAAGRQTAHAQEAARVSAWSTQTAPSTASQAAAAPGAARAATSGPNTAGWSDSTAVRKVSTRQAAATPTTTGSTGKAATHVQVAAVRSRREAQAVAARLTQIGATQPGKRQAEIEEAVMGNMGTLYRVRLGPFANTSELQNVCPRLRDAGLDCLVID